MLRVTGLSQREAATYLNMSLRSIENFASGRAEPKPRIMEELRDLYDAQRDAADRALEALDETRPDELVLGRPADDHEAQTGGWPCVGAWDGTGAMIVAETSARTRIVPLGSEPTTALAAEQRMDGEEDLG